MDSKPQMGNDRLCYKTKVYLDTVRRIRSLVPISRPVHVYLATDDAGNMIHEILNTTTTAATSSSGARNNANNANNTNNNNNNTHDDDARQSVRFENDLGVEEWHFLNYPREAFGYKAISIESGANAENQPFLGETAVADLWLLTHGDAFVGHMGSRFGKVSWLLAMARRNAFVPYFSVDGHSFCCEIDEACGEMKPYITIDNCLTFGHEYIGTKHENYWEKGSVARKNKFLESTGNRRGIYIDDRPQTSSSNENSNREAQEQQHKEQQQPDRGQRTESQKTDR